MRSRTGAGIKHLQAVIEFMDSGFRRSDDLFAGPSILGSAAGNFIDENNAICIHINQDMNAKCMILISMAN
jgi:hypothetical protein